MSGREKETLSGSAKSMAGTQSALQNGPTSTRGSGKRAELTQQARRGTRWLSAGLPGRWAGTGRGGAMDTWKSICHRRCQEDPTAGKAACTQLLPGEQDWEVKRPSQGTNEGPCLLCKQPLGNRRAGTQILEGARSEAQEGTEGGRVPSHHQLLTRSQERGCCNAHLQHPLQGKWLRARSPAFTLNVPCRLAAQEDLLAVSVTRH